MIHLIPVPAAEGSPGAEMRFVQTHVAQMVLGVLAAAGAVAAWTFMEEGVTRLMFVLPAAAASVQFLRSALRRYELVIDPVARTWRRRSGPFFAPRSAAGSLDDLTGVALLLRHIRSGSGSSSRSIPIWWIVLEFAGPEWDGTPLLVDMIESDEPAAYRRLEEYARRLRVDAIDRTAAGEDRRAWQAVDAPVGASPPGPPTAADPATGHAVAAPPVVPEPSTMPPTRTGIVVTIEEGRRRITLPPMGARAGSVLGILAGLLIAAAGAYFALGPLTGLGVPGLESFRSDSTGGEFDPVILIVPIVFVLTGFSAVKAAIERARAREWVLDLPDRLRFGVTRGGREIGRTEVPKDAIEEVSLRVPEEGGATLRVLGARVPLGTRPRPRRPHPRAHG